MAFNGSGTFVRLYNWVTDRNNGVLIEADRHDEEDDGFATGLSNCITKDGQSTPTANIGMGGFKLTNLGDMTNATDAANRQAGDARWRLLTGNANPATDDGASLGISGTAWSDLFLASGAVINWNAGNYTITHTAGDLAFSGIVTVPNTGLHILDTNASHDLIIKPGSDLSADRTLTLTTGDSDRTVTLAGNVTTTGALAMSGAFDLTWTITGNTNVTLPTSGTLAVLGANTFTAGQTVSQSSTSTAWTAQSTEAGATTFTGLDIYRDSATPAANDFIGKIQFNGKDNGAAKTAYAEIDAQILDTTDTSEDGRLVIRTMVAGSMTDAITFGPSDFNYSTGTFPPTVTLNGGAGNTVPVYSTNTGRYTRIGNRVFVDVLLSGDGGAEGAGTGVIAVALPVAATASHPIEPFLVGTSRNGTAENILSGEISAGASVIGLSYFDAINNRSSLTGADQNNATRLIRLQFSYEA